MRSRLLSLAVLIGLLAAAAARPSVASAEQNVASETYYRFDVPNASMTVRVDARIQNASSRSVDQLQLMAMPTAAGVVVTRDGQPLETKIIAGSAASTRPTIVQVQLPKEIRPNAQVELSMTYTVAPHTSELVRMEPGAMELLLVGQGPGSFVVIDLPAGAENYPDPGCVIGTEQPKEVVSAGFERWVCGEVTLAALFTDDESVQKQCANMDDRCRQRLLPTAFSTFVQSITDQSLRGTLEADVQLGNGSVHVTLRFFKRDRVWAEKQFAMAQAVLPRLEALFNWPYPFQTLLMRQSHHIELVGAAGIAFTDRGEVLLSEGTGIDEEVTIHELAHQWAGLNLDQPFAWEGLAEWATQIVGREMGLTLRDWGWEATGYKDPIGTWGASSPVRNPYYWYGKSAAFWFTYETAVGGRERASLLRIAASPTTTCSH